MMHRSSCRAGRMSCPCWMCPCMCTSMPSSWIASPSLKKACRKFCCSVCAVVCGWIRVHCISNNCASTAIAANSVRRVTIARATTSAAICVPAPYSPPPPGKPPRSCRCTPAVTWPRWWSPWMATRPPRCTPRCACKAIPPPRAGVCKPTAPRWIWPCSPVMRKRPHPWPCN